MCFIYFLISYIFFYIIRGAQVFSEQVSSFAHLQDFNIHQRLLNSNILIFKKNLPVTNLVTGVELGWTRYVIS